MKCAKLITWSESGLKNDFGDRGSTFCASSKFIKNHKNLKKSRNLQIQDSRFWPEWRILANKKIWDKRFSGNSRISSLKGMVHMWTSEMTFKAAKALIFCYFWKSNIFDILNFSRRFSMLPNDLRETRESLSWLDLSFPNLDKSSTHAGNRTFWLKNWNFLDFQENSHFWICINQIELHQQNSIFLM